MSGRADVEGLLREAAPQALAVVVRRFGRFADSEEAVQEALIAAARQWPAQGVPESPAAWLTHVASRRMLDALRGERARRRREEVAAAMEPAAAEMELAGTEPAPGVASRDEDDTLALMFMCAHPALTQPSAIALTLRAVAGLSTAEIAIAFVVPEATMAQRISRAKQKVEASGVPFALPSASEWRERLRSVLHVLYLIFNEGYLGSSGRSFTRSDLSAEAIRLARAVSAALPQDAEAIGLLALMLLTEARRPARSDASGALVPLDAQDRTLWRADLIAEGEAQLAAAMRLGTVGEYQLQAAIAAAHSEARTAQETDWRRILGLYELLEQLTGSAIVGLNRAIALAMVEGPRRALAAIEQLEPQLRGSHRLHATRAHLLARAGDRDAAITEYETAARLTASLPERDYLQLQAARLRDDRG